MHDPRRVPVESFTGTTSAPGSFVVSDPLGSNFVLLESSDTSLAIVDPKDAAESAGLRYVSDARAGIRRKKAGKGFAYIRPDGSRLADPEALRRIAKLAIPPAWTDVWICPRADGHVQATGRDARERKQYRYHPRFREVRESTKYGHVLAFADALPNIRNKVETDMALRGLPREKVLATVVHLLETTLIRVGNDDYAKQNKSYGLTTLKTRHVAVEGSEVRFRFTGKSGKQWSLRVRDRRVAKIIKQCQELPGQELIQYLEESGTSQDVTSSDVNDYLKEISGQDITAKDFRTWAGTVLAALALKELEHHRRDLGARGGADRLDGLAALAEHDFALAVALDIDRLLDAHRAVLEFLPDLGLDGRLVGQFLMQPQIKFFARDLGGELAHRRVGNLVGGVEPRDRPARGRRTRSSGRRRRRPRAPRS